MILRPGDEPIPGYHLESFLGKGQFGQVWKAQSPGQTSVALKFLDLSGKQGRKEFRAIQRVKAIRHAHLMPITALWLLDDAGTVLTDDAMDEVGIDSKRLGETLAAPVEDVPRQKPSLLVVAQLLGEKTLGDRLEACKAEGLEGIPIAELMTYMEESAKGIDYLNSATHDLGMGMFAVQHCDIKPANILLIGDSVLICDFGVAQVLAESADTNRATGMVGSPAYMAPECIAQTTSSASDQYSLAVTYVELRTGDLPFEAKTFAEVLDCHRQGRLELSKLPPAERKVIKKATAVDPKKRYRSATEMVKALRGAALGEPNRRDRTKSVLILGAALVVCIACVIGLLIVNKPNPLGQRSLRFEVHPPSTTLTVNGEVLPLDAEGVAQWECDSDKVLLLEASSEPEYLPWTREVSLINHADETIRITLDHNAAFHASRGQKLLDAGKLDEAAEAWARAIRYDTSDQYVRVPTPVSQHAPFGYEKHLALAGVSADRTWLAAISEEGAIQFLDLAAPNHVDPEMFTDGPNFSPWTATFSHHWGVITFLNGAIQVFDLAASPPSPKFAWNISERPQLAEQIEVAISPDERWLLTASSAADAVGESVVHRWDLESPSPAGSKTLVARHADAIPSLVVSSQGDHVITVSWDGTARQWPILSPDTDAEGQEKPGRLLAQHSDAINCLVRSKNVIAFAGAGSYLGNDSGGAEGQHCVTIYRDQVCTSLPVGHSAPVESLAIDGQDHWIATTCESVRESEIHVWNIEGEITSPIVLRSSHVGLVRTMCFDPSSQWLVTGGDDGKVLLWDFENPTHPGPVMLTSTGAELKLVTTTNDGQWLIACGADGVRIWDFQQLKLIKRGCDKANAVPKVDESFPSAVEA